MSHLPHPAEPSAAADGGAGEPDGFEPLLHEREKRDHPLAARGGQLETDGPGRAGDDPVWNLGPQGLPFGEGAGFSAAFARPSYQNGVAKITKSSQRSVPDISLDASAGTSESGPLLNGILALATQLNHGQNVGPINPLLYSVLGPAGLKDGVADVVSGNNDVIRSGKLAVKGFAAAKGFDVASGWGTVRASTFAPALVKATAAAILPSW